MKWFTSDLHFQHSNIVKFTSRGVETTQENHDEWLIERWNAQVAKGDLVYHLGDFSFAKKYQTIADTVRRLNGQKIFIKGNHDRSENLEQLKVDGLIAKWDKDLNIDIQGNKVHMYHFPIGSWLSQGRGSWHLHGHSHGNYQHSRGKMLDVGIDSCYNLQGWHMFFTENNIVKHMQAQENFIADSHRENL